MHNPDTPPTHILLMAGQVLSEAQASEFMSQVMTGQISPLRLAAALAALQARGETPAEIAGFARAMRQHALNLSVAPREVICDVVGTGGDGVGTFNVSTTTAFVVAAAGVCVAKHGNRAASSKSGSADVLEALGVNLAATPQRITQAIDRLGVGFIFARNHHPALAQAAPIRAELAARTVFNVLGPLSNPAGANHLLVGVYRPELTRTLAEVLQLLGATAAMVVHGDGLDELTVSGPNTISLLQYGQIHDFVLQPAELPQLGLAEHPISSLLGGTPQHNAAITRAVLTGQGTAAQMDMVALNAAAALQIAGQVADLAAGVRLAQNLLASGQPWQLLQRYAEMTQ